MSQKRLRKYAGRLTRIYKSACIAAVLFFAVSCASSSKIYLVKRADAASSRVSASRFAPLMYKTPRYIVRADDDTAEGEINNRAADLIEEGKFPQASALLESVITDSPSFAPSLNNLGIIREIFGDARGAFGYYTRACDIDPDSYEYKWNFRNVGDDKK
jgi:tetratricopeptide (TPR) repeat protein